MAQKILWNWQDDDSTKHLNQRTLGIVEPGLYRGFDLDLSDVSNIKLVQTVTGATIVLTDSPVFTTEQRGVVVTKQGVVIHEDDVVSLPFTANASGNPRIDICVLEHEYVDVMDGSNVVYSVLLGTPAGTPVAPTLTSPKTQTILGYLYVPNGAEYMDAPGVVYTRAVTPNFAGDGSIAHQYLLNIFLGIIGMVRNCVLDNVGNDDPVYYFSLNLNSAPAGAVNKDANNFILDYGYTGGIQNENVRLRYVGPDENLGGKEVTIYTKQELRIDFGYDILPSDGDATYCYIPANSVFVLKSVSNTSPVVTDNNKWVLVNAQRASENRSNNFTSSNKFSGTVTENTKQITIGDDGKSSSFTATDGNILKITSMGAPSTVGATSVTGFKALPVDTIIKIDLSDAGITLDHVIFKNNDFVASGDNLPIYTTNSGDLVVNKGGCVWLKAEASAYRVVAVQGEKKYYDGYFVLDNSAFNALSKTITVNNRNNCFSILVPTAESLENINVVDDYGATVDVRPGTIINIRFKHIGGSIASSGGVLTAVPFLISLENTSNIRSNVSDFGYISSLGKSLSIIDDQIYGESGDVITFRKTDTVWEIVSANRDAYYAHKLNDKKIDKGVTWLTADFTHSSISPREASRPAMRLCKNDLGMMIVEFSFGVSADIAAGTIIGTFNNVLAGYVWFKTLPVSYAQTGGLSSIGHLRFGPGTLFTHLQITALTAIPNTYGISQPILLIP